MKHGLQIFTLSILVVTLIVSCSHSLPTNYQVSNPNTDFEDDSILGQSQVIDIVWDSLEPNTSSHNQSNWQVIEVEIVTGEDVIDRFEGESISGCWFGSKPPENKGINLSNKYWYVLMIPYPVTPNPFYDTPSPTAPPLIPEPFLKYAHFLIDATHGEIIARRLICIVY